VSPWWAAVNKDSPQRHREHKGRPEINSNQEPSFQKNYSAAERSCAILSLSNLAEINQSISEVVQLHFSKADSILNQ
jgi:hypothetical protein